MRQQEGAGDLKGNLINIFFPTLNAMSDRMVDEKTFTIIKCFDEHLESHGKDGYEWGSQNWN